MGRIIEGLWDCSYCGTKAIGGSKRTCTNCGRSRDSGTTFYLPGQKRYVPREEAKKVSRKPDWLCEYCGQLSPDSTNTCISCGASRTSENLDYFQVKVKREAEEAEKRERQQAARVSSYTYEDMSYNEPATRTREPIEEPWERKPKREETIIKEGVFSNFFSSLKSFDWTPVIVFILIAALVAGLVYLFIPKDYELTITDIRWERNIDIQEYRTVNESDWYLPDGGRLQYTNREIHHYEDVFDHYETKTRQVPRERYVRTETVVTGYRDLGNGYFEEITSSRDIYETYYETETYQQAVYRSEPVYRTKYYYEIERWVYDRTVTSQAADKQPMWPELNLAENERESSRKETYTVTGKDEEGEEYTFTLSYADWERVHLGQEIEVKLSFGHGELISVDENFVVYEKD